MNYKKVSTLLSVSTDAKTIKGEKKGVLTGILYLAPHNISGFQVCPKASEGCKLACLYTAGRAMMFSHIQEARINKTKWFFIERESFMETLVKDIEKLVRKADKNLMTAAVRLNGTSDIAWEKIACVRNGKKYKNIMEAFPETVCYDYTKILNRKAALAIPNYHLTFSLSESNDKEAEKALEMGFNVAVVMKLKPSEAKPLTWKGHPVINGDESDVRFMDAKGGHIIALTAKGQARYDTSGFVREATQ